MRQQVKDGMVGWRLGSDLVWFGCYSGFKVGFLEYMYKSNSFSLAWIRTHRVWSLAF